MNFKQNINPSKQGLLYEINLGKNNGPYLMKDIMRSNNKSISLLAGAQIVAGLSSFNKSLMICQNRQQQYNHELSHVANCNSRIEYIQSQIKDCVQDITFMHQQQKMLRFELQRLNQKIIQQNSQLFSEYMPFFKNIYKTIKQQNNNQKQYYFNIQRNLKQIGQTKRAVLQGIFKCEQKIVIIQNYFGANDVQPPSSQLSLY